MKKIIKSFLVLVVTLTCVITLASCGEKEEKGEMSRVTVDINPSIELIVDEEQKVVAVSALNDDGSIIIAGEAIVGKSVEDAVNLIVNVSTETGYLVKGEVEATADTVKISVSGDSEYAKKLNDKLQESTNKFLEKNGINATAEKVNAMAVEELRTLVLNNSTYTEEEVNAMSEEDLIKALAVSRIETAELVSEEMKKLYFEAKEYEISFAQKEETAKIIQEIGGGFALIYSGYKQALDLYRQKITEFEELKYNVLISPESDYQKALVAVRDAKAKYLEQKALVASIEVGDAKFEVELKNLEDLYEVYEKAELALVQVGELATKGFDTALTYLKRAEETFTSLDETLSTLDVEGILQAKAVEIEKAMNEVKDNYFETFEKAHAEDIEKINAALAAKKEELKASINQK